MKPPRALLPSAARRFAAGQTGSDAVATATTLVDLGFRVTLEHCAGPSADRESAESAVQADLELLDLLHATGLACDTDVTVPLSAVGLLVDERLALDNASRLAAAAAQCGTTVTLEADDHVDVDALLRVLGEVRREWPGTAVALRAALLRTEDDCAALAGSRVRLDRGGPREPGSVARTDPHAADLAYVRCLNLLLEADGNPVFATHDPRLLEIAGERARWFGRDPGEYELQLPLGVRTAERDRLAAAGDVVRVRAPYGPAWPDRLDRLVERPADVALLLRGLVGRA